MVFYTGSVWNEWVHQTASTSTARTWYHWTAEESTASTIAICSTITDKIWVRWTRDFDVSGTGSSPAAYWVSGDGNTFAPPRVEPAPAPTEAELQQRQQAIADARTRGLAAMAEREAANIKAEALLLSCLTAQQRAEYLIHRHVIIAGRSGIRYRLRPGKTVDVIGADGRVDHRLCFHARDHDIPAADNVVIQKLMLESDEGEVRRIANRHPVWAEDRGRLILPALQ